MKQINIKFSFRIPLSINDIKELWKERTDSNFSFRKNRYWQLRNEVLHESTRWSEVDKDYIISHFNEWIGRYFDKYAQDVLIGKRLKKIKKRSVYEEALYRRDGTGGGEILLQPHLYVQPTIQDRP